MLEDKKIPVIFCLNKCRKLLFKFLFRLFQTEGPEKCISVYTDLSIVLNSFYIYILVFGLRTRLAGNLVTLPFDQSTNYLHWI